MIGFFVKFLLLLAALFTLELFKPVQAHLIMPWTDSLATISTAILSPFDGNVASYGNVMVTRTGSFGVSIMPGCNGVEACLILISAIWAFPAPWKAKLWGTLIGIAAIQGLNIVRIISLFYLGQWDQKWFEFAHLYLWQALIMLDVLITWLIWIQYLQRRTRKEEARRTQEPPHAASR